MRNLPSLPLVALAMAAALAVAVMLGYEQTRALTELQLGLSAWALALAIYGAQGLMSVAAEGQQLRLGRVEPRLTNPLSAGIAVGCLALAAVAALLGIGIQVGWGPSAVGSLAGVGCLILAVLLIMSREAFVGREATLDPRDDGIPW